MPAQPPEPPSVEPDPRFPSGPWTGYFLQPPLPGKHWMELILTFSGGIVTGLGRDRVGEFRIKGRYEVEDGKCRWTKTYVGQHSIAYQGFNEGRGIWGTWEYVASWKGGFHIWPEAMGDPSQARLAEAIEEPQSIPAQDPPVVEPAEVAEPVARASPGGCRLADRPSAELDGATHRRGKRTLE